MSRIFVLGSGAWGTALAFSLDRRGSHQVSLWAHSLEFAEEIRNAGENTQFLPGFPLPASIAVTGECEAIADADIVLSVIPSEFLRSAIARLRPHMHSGQIVVSATKGVENNTYLRMTEVIADCLGELSLPIGALSGPSFAQEVAQGQPTALTVAFADTEIAARIRKEFSSETLRLYTSTDIIGVEVGGAVKNVLAIGAGLSDGLGFGAN